MDTPITLRPRSLSNGRSVLAKSALKNPKLQKTNVVVSAPPPVRAVSPEERQLIDEFGIILPPSLNGFAALEETGRECDPYEQSKSWYKEESCPRGRRGNLMPSPGKTRNKQVVTISQLEIEERFKRSKKSVSKLLSNAATAASVEYDAAFPRGEVGNPQQEELTTDAKKEGAQPLTTRPEHSVWEQISDVASEISRTFDDV